MRSRAEILIKETTTSKHTFDVAQPKLPRLTGEGRGEVATRRVPFCERSEQNNFPFSTFNFPFKGGELC